MASNRFLKQKNIVLKRQVQTLRCCLKKCEDSDVSGEVGTPDVYYNRPYLTVTQSYDTYDEGWKIANGANDYNDAIPDDATIQQIDFSASIPDKLKYFNIWGHKFRFTGLTGGYYDPSDGNYYDVDRNLSDKATEFPYYMAARALIVDHLNGFMWISDRLGSLNYTDNLDESAIQTIEGYTDWLVPAVSEYAQLNDYQYSKNRNSAERPPWNYDSQQNSCSCTPRPDIPTTQCLYYLALHGGYSLPQDKTSTSANRSFFRIHLSGTVPQP